MREILPFLNEWRKQGAPIALATVIETWGSAPRGIGAKMAMTPDGGLAGSVSGGCVEGAVCETGVGSLQGNPPQLLHFGVADETAWEVGLACGGSIEVFVRPFDTKVQDALREALDAERPVATVTAIRGPASVIGGELVMDDSGVLASTFNHELEAQAAGLARAALTAGRSQRTVLDTSQNAAEPVEVFVDVMLPSPALVMIGGAHISLALAAIARTVGYRVIVIDPRKAFGSKERFPDVELLLQEWPEKAFKQIAVTRTTAIVTLTHDSKLDDPALKAALTGQAFYVGALGSPSTHEKRRKRLLAAGLSAQQIDRLHAPVGLDIGARTPEEIALAIMAEIIATRNQRTAKGEKTTQVANPA